MRNMIKDMLSTLNIDIGFIEYNGNAKEYVIFGIYNEEETDKCENDNKSETYYITINYWFSSFTNIDKYKEIIKLFKDNGFKVDGIGLDMKSNGLYGKNIDFIYNKLKESDTNE